MRSLFSLTYNSLAYLVSPFILGRFLIKGIKNREYLKRLNERLGFINFPPQFSCVWFHAVSVGESRAVAPIVNLFRDRRSDLNLLITTTTPTGSEVVKKEFNNYVFHTYFPLDLSLVLDGFIKRANPALVVIVETEIWPNLFLKCHGKDIPVIMINARLSPSSFKGYKRIKSFMAGVLNCCEKILARSDEDAERFISLGVKPNKVIVCGDIKFDITMSKDIIVRAKELRSKITKGKNKLIWIAASTHKGEEEILLRVYKNIIKDHPDFLLIIAPRHPERVDEVLELCKKYNLIWVKRSEYKYEKEFSVFVVDTLGELMLFYGLSNISFVGGSLVKVGGHNLLEPASLGLPIITGKYLFNFEESRQLLLKGRGMIIVDGEQSLEKELRDLIDNDQKRKELGTRAQKIVKLNQGSSLKVFSILNEYV